MKVDSARPKSHCLLQGKILLWSLTDCLLNSAQAPGTERGRHRDLLEDPHSETYSSSSSRCSSHQISAGESPLPVLHPSTSKGAGVKSFQWEMRNGCQSEGSESTKRDQQLSTEGQKYTDPNITFGVNCKWNGFNGALPSTAACPQNANITPLLCNSSVIWKDDNSKTYT